MPQARTLGKILAAAVALVAAHGGVLWLAGQPQALESLGWEVLVLFVMGGALAYAVSRSAGHGWGLVGRMALVAAGVSGLLVALETLVFVGAFDGFAQAVIWWMCRAAGMSVAVVAIFGRMKPSAEKALPVGTRPRWSVAGWAGRVVLAVVAYTVLFMVAGLLIMKLEAVPDYTSVEATGDTTSAGAAPAQGEATTTTDVSRVKVPPLPVIFGFIWVRGLACIAFALPLIYGLTGGRWVAALVVGLALPVLGGVVPLLPPSDAMTTGARFGHMLEIGGSNLLYGLLIGYLFGRGA